MGLDFFLVFNFVVFGVKFFGIMLWLVIDLYILIKFNGLIILNV